MNKYVSKMHMFLIILPLFIGGLLIVPNRVTEQMEAELCVSSLNGGVENHMAQQSVHAQKNNMQAVAPIAWALYYTFVGMSIVKRNTKKEDK